MHRFLSRSDESDDLTRAGAPACGSEAPANVLYGTLRRPMRGYPLAGRAVGAHSTTDEFVDAVENLCIMRARVPICVACAESKCEAPLYNEPYHFGILTL